MERKDPLLDVHQAHEYICRIVSEEQLRKLARRGELQHIKLGKNTSKIYFRASALDAWISSHEKGRKAPKAA